MAEQNLAAEDTEGRAAAILGALDTEPQPGADPTPQDDETAADEIDAALAKADAAAGETPPSGEGTKAPAEPAPPAIEPPKFLKAEYRDKWNTLSADWQRYLVAQEEENSRTVGTKLNEAAEIRKTAEKAQADARTFAEGLNQQFAQTAQQQAQHIDTVVAALVGSDPILKRASDENYWTELAASDPARFTREKAEFDRRMGQITQAVQTRNALVARSQQQFTEQRRQYLADQNRRLLERIPEWGANQATAKKEFDEALAYGLSQFGIPLEEVHASGDHRIPLVLRTAMHQARKIEALEKENATLKGQQSQALASAQRKKVVEAPTIAKPQGTVDTQGLSDSAKARLKEARGTFKESVRADAILAALGRG